MTALDILQQISTSEGEQLDRIVEAYGIRRGVDCSTIPFQDPVTGAVREWPGGSIAAESDQALRRRFASLLAGKKPPKPTILERALIDDAVRDGVITVLAQAAAKFGPSIVDEAHARMKRMDRGSFLAREPRLQCMTCRGQGRLSLVSPAGNTVIECTTCMGTGKRGPQLWKGTVILNADGSPVVLELEVSSEFTIGGARRVGHPNAHDRPRSWAAWLVFDFDGIEWRASIRMHGGGRCSSLTRACDDAIVRARDLLSTESWVEAQRTLARTHLAVP